MTAQIRDTVIYGRDADAATVAQAANRLLEGAGYRVQVGDDGEVWIYRLNQPVTEATAFLPGQRLIVTLKDGWRIEPAETGQVAA